MRKGLIPDPTAAADGGKNIDFHQGAMHGNENHDVPGYRKE
jgi:hypothetical protein